LSEGQVFHPTPPLVIGEGHELMALHRALFEAKFAERPNDRDIAGSPFVASIANRVVDMLAATDPGWNEWREARKHERCLSVVRTRIAECAPWMDWSSDKRREYASALLSPLVADEALMSELICDG
jgi:hypothetical protein